MRCPRYSARNEGEDGAEGGLHGAIRGTICCRNALPAASILGLGLSRGALPAAMLLLSSVSVLYRLWRQHKQDVGAKICSLAWRWELIWSREAEVALLEQMRKYRHLWDPQDHLYKKQNLRKHAFQKYIFHPNLIIAINLTTGDSNQKGPMRQA